MFQYKTKIKCRRWKRRSVRKDKAYLEMGLAKYAKSITRRDSATILTVKGWTRKVWARFIERKYRWCWDTELCSLLRFSPTRYQRPLQLGTKKENSSSGWGLSQIQLARTHPKQDVSERDQYLSGTSRKVINTNIVCIFKGSLKNNPWNNRLLSLLWSLERSWSQCPWITFQDEWKRWWGFADCRITNLLFHRVFFCLFVFYRLFHHCLLKYSFINLGYCRLVR